MWKKIISLFRRPFSEAPAPSLRRSEHYYQPQLPFK